MRQTFHRWEGLPFWTVDVRSLCGRRFTASGVKGATLDRPQAYPRSAGLKWGIDGPN
jgi:hypothetical protein